MSTRDVKMGPMLELVPLSARHARDLMALAVDDPLTPWTTMPSQPLHRTVLAFIAGAQRLRARGARETSVVVDGGVLVGLTLLARDPAAPDHAELGYWIGRPHRSRGYATAAVRQLLSHGFGRMKLALVFARCPSVNRASTRVVEKAGFRLVGLEPSVNSRVPVPPVCRYQLTATEWRGRR
jgi:RimJ/RimL family protein N-acetyltransferase